MTRRTVVLLGAMPDLPDRKEAFFVGKPMTAAALVTLQGNAVFDGQGTMVEVGNLGRCSCSITASKPVAPPPCACPAGAIDARSFRVVSTQGRDCLRLTAD